MKVLSKASIYAIRAMIFMACSVEEGYISIKEMSEKLDISFHFLTKLLQELTREGYLLSYRGPTGGVLLNREPRHIIIKDVIHIFEGKDYFKTCLLGLPGCGLEEPCPVHDFWSKIREEMKEKFETTTLADLKQLENRLETEQLTMPF